jgi:hypothetical protein
MVEVAARATGAAALQDRLELGALAPVIAVEEIMDTKAGLLCYEYAY